MTEASVMKGRRASARVHGRHVTVNAHDRRATVDARHATSVAIGTEIVVGTVAPATTMRGDEWSESEFVHGMFLCCLVSSKVFLLRSDPTPPRTRRSPPPARGDLSQAQGLSRITIPFRPRHRPPRGANTEMTQEERDQRTVFIMQVHAYLACFALEYSQMHFSVISSYAA